MESNNLAELQKEFFKSILDQYKCHVGCRGLEDNNYNFIRFLVGSSLIPKERINKFMVINCYPKVLEKENGHKTRAIYHLETIVPYKKTHIETILKHDSKTFRFNKNILKKIQ